MHPQSHVTVFNVLDFRIKSLREFATLMWRIGLTSLSKRKAVQRVQILYQFRDAAEVVFRRKSCRRDTKTFQPFH